MLHMPVEKKSRCLDMHRGKRDKNQVQIVLFKIPQKNSVVFKSFSHTQKLFFLPGAPPMSKLPQISHGTTHLSILHHENNSIFFVFLKRLYCPQPGCKIAALDMSCLLVSPVQIFMVYMVSRRKENYGTSLDEEDLNR